MRNTKLEINITKFLNNIEKIKNKNPDKIIMPVIKANAYGTYINKQIDIINNFDIVATALVNEGVELRKEGYIGEIFILNQPDIEEIELIKQYDLIIGLSSIEFINKAISEPIRVHLEIETGMNRTGIKLEDLDKYVSIIKNSNIKVEGIYTHLSSADFDKEYTNNQINLFKQALDQTKNIFNYKYIHISASNGILNYNVDFANTIRPGLIMYGYEPFKGANNIIDVEPIATLKTKITFIKDSKVLDKIGYSQKYECPKDMIVATIPIGYADGYRRALSNKGYVVVNNTRCQILGNICMDSCMIDVTDANAKVGDEVILFDDKDVTLDELADICQTINYEIISAINERVPRVFIK